MAQLQEQVLAYLPTSIKAFIEGSSRRELLKKITDTLLVFDDTLLHVETGEVATIGESAIAGDDVTPDSEHLLSDERALARTAAQLLKAQGQSKERSVLLLLPPEEFIATSQAMPGLNRESLLSALKLQTDNLLPAYEQKLSLAVNPASVQLGDEHVALWIPEHRLQTLFEAFSQEGLFVAAIKPRLLNIAEQETRCLLLDRDSSSTAAAVVNQGVLERWLQVNGIDFEQKEFAEQWQRELGRDGLEPREFISVNDFKPVQDRGAFQEYSFFPDGALNARKRVEKGKRLLVAAAAIAGLVLLSSIPFVMQSIEFRRVAASLAVNREMSVEARQDQSIVVNFERDWGVINDFPPQDVMEALYTLQNVLSPEQVSSWEISEGLIRIQGTSNDPQAILQRLEQDPLFTEVVFSRATNNTRYYIDLRLATVNFEAYMVRYFPDE